ncbi:hypothetical protein [Bittarella massiliensis (ex Durand et al. 2017)]|uniref:hypothetical protein n=1 Tax=Bittarella massiliensis (ex Durand et al. 2017) TaxID=1720313 RepID=UPI001AA1BE53|nr:hypothetical protein [Bittarella massiliensis (ex Durand et al. 2017)]MBO1680563.1 hypothetical protein [Bittarella massiliensis (ex Durand et al. 2017)]
MVNLSPARLSSGGAEERIAALENTVLRLRKELEYALQNLDAGNLSPTLAQTLGGGPVNRAAARLSETAGYTGELRLGGTWLQIKEGRIVEVMEDGL